MKIFASIVITIALFQFSAAQNLRSAPSSSSQRQLGPLQDFLEQFFGGFGNNDVCGDEETQCGLGPLGENGVVICKDLPPYFPTFLDDDLKMPVCVPKLLVQDSDVCGCCNQDCPVPCGASCTDDNGDTGVAIVYARTGRERCVSPADSVSAQLLFGVYVCK